MAETIRQAVITRQLLGAMDALERRGLDVKAVHIAPDGAMTVLTESPVAPLASLEVSEDATLAAELAEWRQKHGHG